MASPVGLSAPARRRSSFVGIGNGDETSLPSSVAARYASGPLATSTQTGPPASIGMGTPSQVHASAKPQHEMSQQQQQQQHKQQHKQQHYVTTASGLAEEVSVDTLTQQLDFNKACVAEVYALQRSIKALGEAKDEAAMDGRTHTAILVRLTLATSQLFRIAERLSKTLQALSAHNIDIIKTNVQLKEERAALIAGAQVKGLGTLKSSIRKSLRGSISIAPPPPLSSSSSSTTKEDAGERGKVASQTQHRLGLSAALPKPKAQANKNAAPVDREHQFPVPTNVDESVRRELEPSALRRELYPAAHIDFQMLQIHNEHDMSENDLFRYDLQSRRASDPEIKVDRVTGNIKFASRRPSQVALIKELEPLDEDAVHAVLSDGTGAAAASGGEHSDAITSGGEHGGERQGKRGGGDEGGSMRPSAHGGKAKTKSKARRRRRVVASASADSGDDARDEGLVGEERGRKGPSAAQRWRRFSRKVPGRLEVSNLRAVIRCLVREVQNSRFNALNVAGLAADGRQSLPAKSRRAQQQQQQQQEPAHGMLSGGGHSSYDGPGAPMLSRPRQSSVNVMGAGADPVSGGRNKRFSGGVSRGSVLMGAHGGGGMGGDATGVGGAGSGAATGGGLQPAYFSPGGARGRGKSVFGVDIYGSESSGEEDDSEEDGEDMGQRGGARDKKKKDVFGATAALEAAAAVQHSGGSDSETGESSSLPLELRHSQQLQLLQVYHEKRIRVITEYYQRKLRLAMHKSRPSAPPERPRPRELHAKVHLGQGGEQRFDREHVRMHEVMFRTPHDEQEQEATKSRKRQMNATSTFKRTL